jgi:hypothetical protein
MTGISRRDANDGVRDRPHVSQYVCNVAAELKNKFCSFWKSVATNFRITLVYLAK